MVGVQGKYLTAVGKWCNLKAIHGPHRMDGTHAMHAMHYERPLLPSDAAHKSPSRFEDLDLFRRCPLSR